MATVSDTVLLNVQGERELKALAKAAMAVAEETAHIMNNAKDANVTVAQYKAGIRKLSAESKVAAREAKRLAAEQKKLAKENQSLKESFIDATKRSSLFNLATTAMLNPVIGGTAAITAMAATMNRLEAATMQAANMLADIGKRAESVGVSTRELQEFQAVAISVGIESEKSSDLLKTFVERIGEAGQTKPSGEAVYWLEKFNISLDDILNKPITQVLEEFATGFRTLSSATEQANASDEVFGDSGWQIIEMLKMKKTETDKVIATARKYGVIVSEQMIGKAAEYRKEMALVNQATDALNAQTAINMSAVSGWWVQVKNDISRALAVFTGFKDAQPDTLALVQEEIALVRKEIEGLQNAGSMRDGSNIGLDNAKRDLKELLKVEEDLYAKRKEMRAFGKGDAGDDDDSNRQTIRATSAMQAEITRMHIANIQDEKDRLRAASMVRIAMKREEIAEDKDAMKLMGEFERQEKIKLTNDLAAIDARAAEVSTAASEATKLQDAQKLKEILAKRKEYADSVKQAVYDRRASDISMIKDELARIDEQYALEQEKLNGALAAKEISYAEHMQRMAVIDNDYKQKKIDIADEIGAAEAERQEKVKEDMLSGINTMTDSFTQYAASSKEDSAEMRENFIRDVKAMILQQLIFAAISGLSGGEITHNLGGGLGVKKNAKGGVMHGQGMYDAGNSYSENGAEVIAPLGRSKTGELGLNVSGLQQSSNINNAVTVNVSGGGDPDAIGDAVSAKTIEAMRAIAQEQIVQSTQRGRILDNANTGVR